MSVEFDFGPALQIEQRIDAHEVDAITERWEFGRWMLTHVPEGGKKLPVGFLGCLADATGKGRSELKARRQLAECYPTQEALADVSANHKSWFAIVHEALPTDQPELALVEPIEADPLPDGEFRAIVADPPWQYGNTKTRGAAEDHYGTMTIAELADLDVEARAAGQAHLYLWVTNNFIREGFELIDAWGFDYKTCLTWVKPQMGMGNYFRGCTEHVLFGVRGGLRTNERDIRNWFQAPRGRHSAKPDSFYDLVEKASPGPYLEMFSRRSRFGWSVWGNEALQDTEVARVAA